MISAHAVGSLVLCAGLLCGCSQERSSVSQNIARPEPTATPVMAATPIRALSEIDLTKVGHVAPKGRVQDKDYNQLEVIDDLLANGKQSIPFLISKLDDQRVIKGPVFDFRQKTTVSDVAFVILSDFSTDTKSKHTIPGSDWGELLGTLPGPDIPTPFWDYLDEQFARHSRSSIKAKWERIWATWQDKIFWDEKERCFSVNTR